MDFLSAEKRAAELREILNYHSRKYYVEDNPEISDYEYDMLQRELVAIEKEYPQLITADSPTQRVGGSADGLFEPVVHAVPLESLQDAFSYDEVRAFDARVSEMFADTVYVVEPKIDGLSVALEYENGLLVRASTRGDGNDGIIRPVLRRYVTVSNRRCRYCSTQHHEKKENGRGLRTAIRIVGILSGCWEETGRWSLRTVKSLMLWQPEFVRWIRFT